MNLSQAPSHDRTSDAPLTHAACWARLRLVWLWLLVALYGHKSYNAALNVALGKLSQLVGALVIIHAARLFRSNGKAAGHSSLTRLAARRALEGSKLRRALRHRDPLARIAALLSVLDKLEAWARRMTRRLVCGLTRRLGGGTIDMNAPPICAGFTPSPTPNSS